MTMLLPRCCSGCNFFNFEGAFEVASQAGLKNIVSPGNEGFSSPLARKGIPSEVGYMHDLPIQNLISGGYSYLQAIDLLPLDAGIGKAV